MGNATPETLVLLPGLDGTEVFFRPLLASLPEWIRPHVVSFPPAGATEYADLLAIVRKAVADIPSFLRAGIIVCRALSAHARGGRTGQGSGRDPGHDIREAAAQDLCANAVHLSCADYLVASDLSSHSRLVFQRADQTASPGYGGDLETCSRPHSSSTHSVLAERGCARTFEEVSGS